VVHNCTPNHLHAQINRQILAAGLHVFSEKPLCMTAEEARELVALAEGRRGAWRQLCLSPVRHGAAGGGDDAQWRCREAVCVHGSYLQDWMLLETDYNWRVDSAQGGASRAVADIGSHWCDTVQFMTGGALSR
jgi:predicted dehydrogenase